MLLAHLLAHSAITLLVASAPARRDAKPCPSTNSSSSSLLPSSSTAIPPSSSASAPATPSAPPSPSPTHFSAASAINVTGIYAAVQNATATPLPLGAYPVRTGHNARMAQIYGDWLQMHPAPSAFTFVADMDTDCDGVSENCEGNADGQNATAFGALDATRVPYFVLPLNFTMEHRNILKPNALGAIICGQQMVYGIYGDQNGDDPQVIGEASILVGQTCFPRAGINGGRGHDRADVAYIVFGTQVPTGVGESLIDVAALKALGDSQMALLQDALGIDSSFFSQYLFYASSPNTHPGSLSNALGGPFSPHANASLSLSWTLDGSEGGAGAWELWFARDAASAEDRSEPQTKIGNIPSGAVSTVVALPETSGRFEARVGDVVLAVSEEVVVIATTPSSSSATTPSMLSYQLTTFQNLADAGTPTSSGDSVPPTTTSTSKPGPSKLLAVALAFIVATIVVLVALITVSFMFMAQRRRRRALEEQSQFTTRPSSAHLDAEKQGELLPTDPDPFYSGPAKPLAAFRFPARSPSPTGSPSDLSPALSPLRGPPRTHALNPIAAAPPSTLPSPPPMALTGSRRAAFLNAQLTKLTIQHDVEESDDSGRSIVFAPLSSVPSETTVGNRLSFAFVGSEFPPSPVSRRSRKRSGVSGTGRPRPSGARVQTSSPTGSFITPSAWLSLKERSPPPSMSERAPSPLEFRHSSLSMLTRSESVMMPSAPAHKVAPW
ncbi:Endo-chitosanase [Mycena kentingensis (nom. inval.)]|nr:Endo-chitosanase [Mycena kentingensis (nom. inval.)]